MKDAWTKKHGNGLGAGGRRRSKIAWHHKMAHVWGLPLIIYASRGVGGQSQCIQMRTRGEGGSEHDRMYAFCTQVY